MADKPKASHNNTKAPMTKAVPHGKDNAKITEAPTLKHGKYL